MLHKKEIIILAEFLKGYNRKIYGREVVEDMGMSQKSIALTLYELEKRGFLVSELVGNIKYYSLNFFNPLITKIIFTIESINSLRFFEKNLLLLDLFEKINAEIVCVFGSYSKGKNKKDSDLDLFVVGKIDTLEIKSLGEEFGINIQVFNVSYSDFSKKIKLNDVLIKEVIDSHVLIKGHDKFIEEVIKWLN